MALEDALGLDPIAEMGNRERERMMDARRRSAVGSMSRERHGPEGVETDGYCYTGVRKGAGWIGGGPARLTGYYYHSERDHCDL
jgi:hypothetical protein